MQLKKYSVCFFILLFALFSFATVLPSTSEATKKKVRLKKKQPRRTAVTRVAYSPRSRVKSKDPYLGAIVIDAATGETLFEDNPDVKGYPASMVKMMNLLVVLKTAESGVISLEDKITVSAEVSRIGGSQVYLKENEIFTVDDLLYALIVQSANDAALALAIHTAGTKNNFIRLMNKQAEELGMKDTVFHSVHGLPPGRGQRADTSTPRDITKLARELIKHPDALKYTSTVVRPFRTDAPEPFIMRNHNHLVGDFKGCDGLKTGFFYLAGFSITATAANSKGRAIAVILGSSYSKVRDEKARELLSMGLMDIALKPPTPPEKITASMASLDGPFTSGSTYISMFAMAFGIYAVRKFNT
jgi:D-alanyl-D-alanine carboxypeptidase (penicillin-binding protein 5/6)